MDKVITAIFQDRETADRAFLQLEAAGVSASDINIIMSDEARRSYDTIEESSKVDEGTAAGAGIGGIIGAIAGIVASAGVLVVPGLNLVVAGTLVSALAGTAVGGMTGGLLGFLVGAGIPEHEAKYYEKEIKEGNVFVAVKAHSPEQQQSIEKVLRAYNARDIAA